MRKQQIPGFPDAKSANTLAAVHTHSHRPLRRAGGDRPLLAQLGPLQCALDLAVVSPRLWVGLPSRLPASSNEQLAGVHLQNLHFLSWGGCSANKSSGREGMRT